MILLFPMMIWGQGNEPKLTLSGYIKDAASGETLIGASVYISSLGTGTTSNEYGFYSISIPAGSYQAEYSYLGFQSQVIDILLKDQNKSLDCRAW